MNNTIMRTVEVTEQFHPLVPRRLVASVTLACPPTNAGNVVFLGDDGSEVAWLPGEWHRFERIDLATVQIKGVAGDVVSVVGGTW